MRILTPLHVFKTPPCLQLDMICSSIIIRSGCWRESDEWGNKHAAQKCPSDARLWRCLWGDSHSITKLSVHCHARVALLKKFWQMSKDHLSSMAMTLNHPSLASILNPRILWIELKELRFATDLCFYLWSFGFYNFLMFKMMHKMMRIISNASLTKISKKQSIFA